ncbi:MAG: hypothetical protein JWN73_3480 [Betaproteobacteria bacterium]|nr:hypothetical protein [Betaproteobacteria bacterium]
MGKILLLLVLALVVVAWFRARARREEIDEAASRGQSPAAAPRQVAPEQMVSCAQCGLNLPASEAVFDAGGVAYCGAPHLEAARARQAR